jgi:hypothetical protein
MIWCCGAEADAVHRAEPWSLRGHYCLVCGAFYPSLPASVSFASSLAPPVLEAMLQQQRGTGPQFGKGRG